MICQYLYDINYIISLISLSVYTLIYDICTIYVIYLLSTVHRLLHGPIPVATRELHVKDSREPRFQAVNRSFELVCQKGLVHFELKCFR